MQYTYIIKFTFIKWSVEKVGFIDCGLLLIRYAITITNLGLRRKRMKTKGYSMVFKMMPGKLVQSFFDVQTKMILKPP